MDPISIVGITTTSLGVLERLAKSLKFLLEMSIKYRQVDSRISLLVGYLSSIQMALNQIVAIVRLLSEVDVYKEVAESLSTTLDCTSFSLSFLEDKIGSLGLSSSNDLSVLDKVVVLFKASEFDEYLSSINSFVNAMNLQLNVLQRLDLSFLSPATLKSSSRSLLEQQGILKSTEAQVILETMEDETSSLLCIGDSRSILSKRSQFSDHSTALSVTFAFDSDLLSSRIYQVAHRSYLRHKIASGKKNIPEDGIPDATSENSQTNFGGQNGQTEGLPRPLSKTISSTPLSLVRTPDSPEFKMLILGASDSGKSTWRKAISLFEEGDWVPGERREAGRQIIFTTFQNALLALEAMDARGLTLTSAKSQDCARYIRNLHHTTVGMSSKTAMAIAQLRDDDTFKAVLHYGHDYYMHDHAQYFFHTVSRLSGKDFVPSNEDILRHYQQTYATIIRKVQSTSHLAKGKDFVVVDVGGMRPLRKKWDETMEDVSLLIFTVDMGAYDQVLQEDPTVNRMADSLMLFEHIMSFKSFEKSKIVLCFTKQQKLAIKIARRYDKDELPNLFQDDLSNIAKKENHIMDRFKRLIPDERLGNVLVMILPDLPLRSDWEHIKQFAESTVRLRWPDWRSNNGAGAAF